MKNLLPTKRTIIYLIMIIVGYHVVFSTARDFIDFKYPNGWYRNTVVAFGEELRVLIFSDLKKTNTWRLSDTQPEKQKDPKHGTIGTRFDNNIYDYETEMGWFYRYKTFYAYGRNGFWMIQNDPFHIKLLRASNIPEEDAQKLDETIAGYNIYGDQFTVVHSESDLTREEKEAYARIKAKAQPRIETLKGQGLFP